MNNFVFFGTSEFAIPILDALKKDGYVPALIITTPDKPAGRSLRPKPPPVKEWATKNMIPYLQPEKLLKSDFNSLNNYELFIVAAYGKIIPKEILDIPERGSLNIHPSLLPRWRGADPIRGAMLAGEEKTGVTIMLLDEKMDHGPVLKHETLNLNHKKYYYKELEKELAELGGQLLVETLPKWLAGEIEPKEQDHAKATYTKKVKKEDGHVDWSEPAEMIERKIRALNPWPGTYTFWEEKRVKILEGKIIGSENKNPGIVFKYDVGFAVAGANGAILLKKLQLEGKKLQTAAEFLNGYPNIIGAILN